MWERKLDEIKREEGQTRTTMRKTEMERSTAKNQERTLKNILVQKKCAFRRQRANMKTRNRQSRVLRENYRRRRREGRRRKCKMEIRQPADKLRFYSLLIQDGFTSCSENTDATHRCFHYPLKASLPIVRQIKSKMAVCFVGDSTATGRSV